MVELRIHPNMPTNFTVPMVIALHEIAAKSSTVWPLGVKAPKLISRKNTRNALVERAVVVCNGGRYMVSSVGRLVLAMYRAGVVEGMKA